MATTDDDIDRLYQLPLDQFTPARNELAKRLGAGGAAIKKLEKPNAAAWLVNQLFWQRRKTFDRLIGAAQAMRHAHQQRMAGKSADVAAAEAAHQSVMKAAADEIRALAAAAGDAASPATMTAVSETLMALHSADGAGRLTRPLKPSGFEALTGLLAASGPGLRLAKSAPAPLAAKAAKPASPPPSAPGASRQQKASARAAARQAEAAHAREVAALERDIQRARADETTAAAGLRRARTVLDRAERRRAELSEELDAITEELRSLRTTAREGEQAAAEALSTRERLQMQLAALRGRRPAKSE